MSSTPPSRGLRTFLIVWSGQFVLLIGTGLTGFVLGLYVFQQTHSVTQFALILVSGALPRILLSPLAGALVDRWDRRWVMLLADAGAGLSVLAVALLDGWHLLAVWQVYLATLTSAACGAFHYPAYVASTTLLVPKKQLGGVNGLLQLGLAAQDIIAPPLAGVLIAAMHISGVLLIDVSTFVIAVLTLLIVRFPALPAQLVREPVSTSALLYEMHEGWMYLLARRGLLGLLLFFATTSLLNGILAALIYPLILSFTSASQLGVIVALAGGGMLLSSLGMSAWGGPKRRILGVFSAEVILGVGLLVIGLRSSALLIAVGAVIVHLALPVSLVTNQAIWQSKLAPSIQGRVFALQQLVGRLATLISYLLAGPLADQVFNPLLTPHGALAGSLGRVIGVGKGRGIGFMFLLMGGKGGGIFGREKSRG